MNRTVALLVLGAILTVVSLLVDKDGAMSRLAGMDEDRIQAAVDNVGSNAMTGAGLEQDRREVGSSDRIVHPDPVGEFDEEPEFSADEAEPAAESEELPAAELAGSGGPDQPNLTSFDPRIG